jgi:hypothetical protein
MLNPSAVGFPPPRCHSFAAASIGSSPIIARSKRTKVWPKITNPAQGARQLTARRQRGAHGPLQAPAKSARPNIAGVKRCRLFHVDCTIGIIMIAAMLTLVVVALLMVVALMFAAEIGWLMINAPGK